MPSCWYPTRLAGQVVEYVAKVELEDQKPQWNANAHAEGVVQGKIASYV